MINLKIKTLDSQNHDFSVEDEITVRQFKEHIAEKTNVTADMQRLIYCGRVLMDDMLLKEYNLNGKVVHLVQRPPPSSRPPANTSGDNAANVRARGNHELHQGRGVIRGLDLFGAMAIPINNAPTITAPSLNPASTLCMNRITVARHMLECANNIIAYLENPEQGLNNTPMDILSQQTMESTVFEVGISAVGDVDIPQHQMQNFVQAFQGAVTAAFRQNGLSNVTLQQNDGIVGEIGTPIAQVINTVPISPSSSETTGSTADSSSGISSSTASSNSSNEDITIHANTRPRQQTTSTQTLAEVVQQMRMVQTRMEPFLQQYYDLLLLDPSFTAEETTERETAQRTFNRVSEALHYMSHAQHAISDLMLDFQSQTPRHLSCRPILIEQSAYVSSGITAVPNTINFTNLLRAHNMNNNNNTTSNNNNTTSAAATASTTTAGNTAAASTTTATGSAAATTTTTASGTSPAMGVFAEASNGAAATVSLDINFRGPELDAPTLQDYFPRFRNTTNITTCATTTNTNTTTSANNSNQESSSQQIPNTRSGGTPNMARRAERILRPVIIEGPTQIIFAGNELNRGPNNYNSVTLPIASLISEVLNPDLQRRLSNTIGTGTGTRTTTASTNTSSSVSTTSTSTSTSTTNIDPTQPRVTTITLPTTSTQTRSTSRPQVHIASGTLPTTSMRNTRPIPANMLSSFDRFLSCNSHHIQDNQNTNDPTIRNRLTPPRADSRTSSESNTPIRTAASRFTFPHRNIHGHIEVVHSAIQLLRHVFTVDMQNNLVIGSPSILNLMRSQLRDWSSGLFNGEDNYDDHIHSALNQLMCNLEPCLVLLAPYEMPDFDIRGSIVNLLRQSLPSILRIVMLDSSNDYGTRLIRECAILVKKFLTILRMFFEREDAVRLLTQISTSILPIRDSYVDLHRMRLLQAVIQAYDSAEVVERDIEMYLVHRRHGPLPVPTPMETDDQIEDVDVVGIDEPAPDIAAAAACVLRTDTSTSTIPDEFNEIIRTLDQPPGIPATTSTNNEETLPSVVIGSESWHTHFPSNWIPVITRDMGRQRRQSSTGSYSDAYISGMSSKRRKVIANSKPNSDIPSLLNDGIRNAVQSIGGINTSNLDEVSSAIASDVAVQSSYREAVVTSVQERLNNDKDYNPEKFPNIKKVFKKKQ